MFSEIIESQPIFVVGDIVNINRYLEKLKSRKMVDGRFRGGRVIEVLDGGYRVQWPRKSGGWETLPYNYRENWLEKSDT